MCANEYDDIELLLEQSESENPVQSVRNINHILSTYSTWKRIPKDNDLLVFWESKRYAESELYELACVVLSAPVTQVSVKRLFLKHIVSHLRYNLQMHLIDDIMVVRCNALFNS